MKLFKDLRIDVRAEKSEELEKEVKETILILDELKALRNGWIKRRQDELAELDVLFSELKTAYEDGQEVKVFKIRSIADTFNRSNQGRSKNYVRYNSSGDRAYYRNKSAE